jgi:hypothetical protein
MPGFTATKAKADATDTYLAAVPNPADNRPAQLYSYLAKAYPKESGNISIAYGDLDTIRFVKDQTVAVLDKLGEPFNVKRRSGLRRAGPGLQAHLPERQGLGCHDDQLHR